MKTQKKDYVKKVQKDEKNQEDNREKELSVDDQLFLFAELLIDIYFEEENKITQDEEE
ncbi:MAG: hypothetical protein WCK60_03530 [Candidatus Nomurabacteria bacterium]|jgi:hypothetical protein